LAVAAAVAEHNKRQPRRWTPFALRAQQLKVAQVLLAERQRQVAAQQQQQVAAHMVQPDHEAAAAPATADLPGATVQGRDCQPSATGPTAAAPAATATRTPLDAVAAAPEPAPAAVFGSQAGRDDGDASAHVASQQQQQQQQQRQSAAQGKMPTTPGDRTAGREQKPSKKKWLACFAPRTFS
jgi:hypothetical protein